MKRFLALDAGESPTGKWVVYEDAADLQRQLAAVTAERDDWKNTHDGLRAVYYDIGKALGAVMPAQLVNDVARRRMEQLAIATVLVRDQMDEIKRLNAELDQLRGVSK